MPVITTQERVGAWAKAMRAYRDGRLLHALALRWRPFWGGARYLLRNPAARTVRLHAPSAVRPDPREREVVSRIFEAFKKMKRDEREAPAWYAPAPMWRRLLDEAYRPLRVAAEANDLEAFHDFLANFGASKTYLGVDAPALHAWMRSWLARRFVQNEVFARQVKFWRWFYRDRKPLTDLTQPMHGNQMGAYIDGVFVSAGAAFNEIQTTLLAALLGDIDRPVVAELGAGYGKFAHFLLRHFPRFAYLDFDLPETLCLGAYYLLLSYPEKKSLLYGEAPYRSGLQNDYDLIFMPSFEMSALGRSTVDLFLNKNSLGEMSEEATRHYISVIADASRFFFHMNHDVYPNEYGQEGRSLLGHEYPVPSGRFRLVFRYPDLGHLLGTGALDWRGDIFMYLYERRQSQDSPAQIDTAHGEEHGQLTHEHIA